MLESTALLTAQARRLWGMWAPAVLACDGDPAREDAALRRPGVAVARQEYDDVLAELGRREARTGLQARLGVCVAADMIDRALLRAPSTCQ